MATNSPLLRLTLQATGENPNSWGSVANAGVFQLLEDAIAGVSSITMNGVNQSLTVINGATDQARNAVIHATGPALSDITLTIPSLTKLYAVVNESLSIITISAGGTTLAVPAGGSSLVFCDGTNIISASKTNSVATASFATNAGQLNGISAASYARLDVNQTFSKGQSVARVTLPSVTGGVTMDASVSNTFFHQLTGNITMNTPLNPKDGQAIRIAVKQDNPTLRTITWAPASFAFSSGVDPVMTQTAAAVDYYSFEYVSAITKWIGGSIQDVS